MGRIRKDGPIVFITGASSGIGAALARHYAAQGATLGLAARRLDALQALAAELEAPCHLYPLDVSAAAALQAAGEDFIARAGVPDIVIANAGVSVGTLTEEADDLPAFRRVFDTNVMGMVQTFQPFVAAMRAVHAGRLVGIASVAGIRGLPGAGAYSASKAAAIAYLESLRPEPSTAEERSATRLAAIANVTPAQLKAQAARIAGRKAKAAKTAKD